MPFRRLALLILLAILVPIQPAAADPVEDFYRGRTVTLAVGTRLPAFHTSLGRVQLGFLDDGELWCRLRSLRIEAYTPQTITDLQALFDRIRTDRAQRFSIVDEELERGLRALAVPVLDRSGQAVGAINLSTHSTRTTRNAMREHFLPELNRIADQVSSTTV